MCEMTTTFFQNPSMKLVRILTLLTCLIGCGYQMYEISSEFFAFEVRMEIKFIKPPKIKVPVLKVSNRFTTSLNRRKFEESQNQEIIKVKNILKNPIWNEYYDVKLLDLLTPKAMNEIIYDLDYEVKILDIKKNISSDLKYERKEYFHVPIALITVAQKTDRLVCERIIETDYNDIIIKIILKNIDQVFITFGKDIREYKEMPI